jgi:hypothetical protein
VDGKHIKILLDRIARRKSVATCESKQGIKASKVLILGVVLRKSELIKPRVEDTP